MKYRLIIHILCLSALLCITIPLCVGADVDCRICHQGGAISAEDTISPDDSTCFKCHNPDHPPKWEGLEVHRIHLYNIIMGERGDYIERHPLTELECTVCHQHEYSCTDCHIKELIHTGKSADCNNCHRTMDDLFRHRSVNLTKHNVFGLDAPGSCELCHNRAGGTLRLTTGKNVEITDSQNLCEQCHSTVYKEWKEGEHWTNLIRELDTVEPESTCTYCHNVHAPEELYWIPPPSGDGNNFPKSGVLLLMGICTALLALFVRRYRSQSPK